MHVDCISNCAWCALQARLEVDDSSGSSAGPVAAGCILKVDVQYHASFGNAVRNLSGEQSQVTTNTGRAFQQHDDGSFR